MLELLVSVASSISILLATNDGGGECWNVDRTTVMGGGCVTIIVDKPCNESWDLMLQIDDRRPFKLLQGAGPRFHRRTSRLPGREATLVLFFRDFTDTEAFEQSRERPGHIRWLTAFDEPGVVHLTLYDGEESLGTETVRVEPCSPEAETALELLNPALTGKKRSTRDALLWSTAAVGETFRFSPPLTERELTLMREQLPIIMQHPDWAEIAEMRFAGVEAWHYIQQVSEEGESRFRLKGHVVNPKFPAIVTDCLTKQVHSPFAQAVQDQLRDTAGILTDMIKARESETGVDDH